MKLAFVTDNGFSRKNGMFFYSGANVQHYYTVTKHFEDIVFVARNNSYEPSSNVISNKYQVYLVDSIVSGKDILNNYKKLDKILERVIIESDIVMCFGINGYFAYRKAQRYKKPVLIYVGGCVYDTLINMNSYLKKMSAPIVKFFVKIMIKNANYVHYVDQYLVDRYPTKGNYLICPSVRISIDQNAIIFRKKSIVQKSKITKIGLIGYANNKIKGIDTAIRSLKLLGDKFKLEVVGRGDHSWLDNLAKRLNVENQVKFLGILSGREVIFKWLDSIDIYIQPSLTEGMPRATIEAMSRGCPIVSSNAGGLKNIIDKEFRIKSGDYIELANKINSLSKDKVKMFEQGNKNFIVASQFNSIILDKKRNNFYEGIHDDLLERFNNFIGENI
ncbi:glycosyltransferase family 4 protein [Sporanaerobacter sp. PP17-6a]|uniref:glycosyltransferase family 4 protein n=1 Tax=Sporanaerobacter sp. PP17-6a TaxID=1891289 RepID=UPI00089FE956|nr:glycosyltransferase family 4 protein [Sporanaerobacter sp. PP17-6a]SCL85412.1 colanic acid biosynthesis glycosyltransferase WcaL [Sporanaerobacter sp. PP17-6a]